MRKLNNLQIALAGPVTRSDLHKSELIPTSSRFFLSQRVWTDTNTKKTTPAEEGAPGSLLRGMRNGRLPCRHADKPLVCVRIIVSLHDRSLQFSHPCIPVQGCVGLSFMLVGCSSRLPCCFSSFQQLSAVPEDYHQQLWCALQRDTIFPNHSRVVSIYHFKSVSDG